MTDQIIVLTPHEVVILAEECVSFDPKTRHSTLVGDAKVLRRLPPSGTVARCTQTEESCEPISGIPTCRVTFGSVEGLPPEADGVYYVTSALVAQAAAALGRHDCLIPARVVRDADGKVVGCLALSRV